MHCKDFIIHVYSLIFKLKEEEEKKKRTRKVYNDRQEEKYDTLVFQSRCR